MADIIYNMQHFQYEFNWTVKDREAKKNGAFFEHNESKKEDTPDRTEGEYRVIKLERETVD